MNRIFRFLARERQKLRRRVNMTAMRNLTNLAVDGRSGVIPPKADSVISAEEKLGISSGLFVDSSDEAMVIRLESVDEDNYGSIISALRERGKRWELTNLNGERILKILP